MHPVDEARRRDVGVGSSEAGRCGSRLSTIENSTPGADLARICSTASPWREHQVVGGGDRLPAVVDARRMAPEPVAEERGAPRLVQRQPVVDPVAERVEHEPGVLGEAVRGVARRPAAGVLQLLRQVPVEERRVRLDPGLEQRVDEPAVEVEAALVRGPACRPAARAARRSRSGRPRARART